MIVDFIGYIHLKFRRTVATHSRCTFPNCPTPLDRLRLISKLNRFKAIKTKNFFITSGSRACFNHYDVSNWDINSMETRHAFNQNHVKDIIDLLTSENTLNVPSNLDIFYPLEHIEYYLRE